MLAAAMALTEAHDAGVAGPSAVPAVARTAVVTLALFAVCGYGPAALLLPAALRGRLALFVLPVGAACSTLALTVLGLLHVPLKVSVAVVPVAGAALAIVAWRRRPRSTEAAPRLDPVVHLAVPLALAALIAAMALLPTFRAGFATVQGQNGDAVLAVGTAEFLRHAPPTALRPELGLDRVPILWRSKLPIYYGLAATSELAGQETFVAFSTVTAIAVGLAALGFFAFAVDGLGVPAGIGLLALFAVGLDRIVLYTAIHPYYNQTWALFALPFVLLFGWRGSFALAALFAALAVFTYPLLLPFPLVFLGVIAWRRRGRLDWRGALRVPPRWVWPIAAIIAVPVAAVLVRGVVEKVVPAIDAVRPGGDLSGWSGTALPYLPFAHFVGAQHMLFALAILVAAFFGLRALRGDDGGRALAVLLAGALLAGLYLRARGQGQLFYFKDLAFAGPLIVTAAVIGVARLPRLAAVVAFAALFAVLTAGARREIGTTYDQLPRDLMALRAWDREIPAAETIRIDVPPSGWQLWSWYLLARHRVTASDPLGGFFPHPPRGRRADLVLVRYGQRRPRDAVGRPLRANSQVVLYRLRRGLPGPDAASRTLQWDVKRITY